MSATLRRVVAVVVTVTMSPWLTACHHQVRVSPARAASMVGTRVHVYSTIPILASAAKVGEPRSQLTDVVELEGVLVTVTADSIRARDASIIRADGVKSGSYREVVLPVTREMIIAQRRIEPVGTSVLVVLGGLAVLTGAAFVYMLVKCGLNSGSGGC